MNTTNTTRTVTVQKSYGSLRKGGAPLLLLLGVVGLAGLARARYRGILTLTEQEQEYLAYSRARDEFDDWITTVELGTSEFDADPIDVETLDGLVDIAIDSDRRVLQDAATGEYRCKVDDVIYRYVPPAEPDENQSTPDLFETTATRERESDEWEEEPTTDGAGTEASTDGSETESDDQ